MQKHVFRGCVRAATLAVLPFAAGASWADTVTNIVPCGSTTMPCSAPWNGNVNGSLIAAAPPIGNTGTGLDFADYNGSPIALAPAGGTALYDGSVTIRLATPIALNSHAVVNALMNNFFGTANLVEAQVTFTNSAGATASFSLVGDQTIRDYNNYIYTNNLQGFNTNPAFGKVTAQEWWNDDSQVTGSDTQRLDAQTFVLPASWAGTNLTSITIANPTSGDWDVLSAVQVDDRSTAAVPEPASAALLGLGLCAVVLVRRRYLFGM
jgi:PEP-CTERM motif